jgi:hypothetical protein
MSANKSSLFKNRQTAPFQKTWIFINTYAKTSRVAMTDWPLQWMLSFSAVRWQLNVYTPFDNISLQVRMFKYVRLMNQRYQSAHHGKCPSASIAAVTKHTSCYDLVSPGTGFDGKTGRKAYCQLQSDLEFHSVVKHRLKTWNIPTQVFFHSSSPHIVLASLTPWLTLSSLPSYCYLMPVSESSMY